MARGSLPASRGLAGSLPLSRLASRGSWGLYYGGIIPGPANTFEPLPLWARLRACVRMARPLAGSIAQDGRRSLAACAPAAAFLWPERTLDALPARERGR
jgi:hypothetical protein